jgi:excisionase family DNA binding protein
MGTEMDFMTYEDVANALSVNVKTVKRWVRDGRLRPARIGVRTVRFLPEDIQTFVERHRVEPP